MKNLQSARSHFEKAMEIEGSSTRFYREFNDQVRAEISAIRSDRDLSEEGRSKRTQELKNKRGVELMQKSFVRKQQYQAELQNAKKYADSVLYGKLQKPDQTKLERFESELRALQTELLLSTQPASAFRKLTDFINRIDDAYLANTVHEQFADLAMPIISLASGSEAAQFRLQLSQTFDRVKRDHETDEIKEARQLLDTANAMLENPRLYNDLVRQAALETLGKEYSSFINTPETYFERYPDLKPAVVLETEKPKSSGVDWGDDDGFKEAYKALKMVVNNSKETEKPAE